MISSRRWEIYTMEIPASRSSLIILKSTLTSAAEREDWYVPHDVNREVKVYPQQNISREDVEFDFSAPVGSQPEERRQTAGEAKTSIIDEDVEFECISGLYEHLNQRGYASVFCGGLGTRGSEGYTLSGSREEIMAFKAVIDWLCGRCRAFTNKTDNIEICLLYTSLSLI